MHITEKFFAKNIWILKKSCNFAPTIKQSCFCGGIGRRARLKIWCPQGLKGSSPFRSTKRR